MSSNVNAMAKDKSGSRRGMRQFFEAVSTSARYEWLQIIARRVTPLFQAGFLVSLAIAVFLVGRVYETDVTNLDVQWLFLPWISVIFIPALAMPVFADTPGEKRLELIAGLPISPAAFVIGRWLAGCVLLLTTLLLTFPFPLTMAYLGNLDIGTAIAGYIGSAGLLATYYAIALLAAALTRDQVGGYVTGVVALLVFQLIASDTATGILRGTSAEHLSNYLVLISPAHWMADMATGRVAIAGLALFATIVVLALGAVVILVARRRAPPSNLASGQRLRQVLRVITWLVIAVLPFTLALSIDADVDLTEAREFTLHAETRATAENAPPGTKIDFYWNASNTDIPASIRQHASRVQRLLKRIERISAGRITLVTHDPAPDTEAEDQARINGVQSVSLSAGGNFMLGASFSHDQRHSSIAYFVPDRAPALEYDIASTLAALARKKTPKIGILSPLILPRNATEPRTGLTILEEIKRLHDVAIIPHFAEKLPDDLDALIVIDATILKPSMLYAIDQHVMAGRGLIIMMDPFARFNTSSNAVLADPSETVNDISDLLLKYGLRFEGAQVIGDPQQASTVGAGDQRFLYPFWLRVRKEQLSGEHQTTAGLNEMGFAEPGSFTILKPKTVQPLITTTEQAGALGRTLFKDGNPQALAAQLTPGGGSRVIAAAISGHLNSAFAKPVGSADVPITTQTDHARVIAVADIDWIFDPLTYTETGAEGRQLARPLNDNIAALSNFIDWTSGQASLAGIRSRGHLSRPFVRLHQMLAEANERYRTKEAGLLERIQHVEQNVRKVLEVSGARSLDELPASIQEKVRELRRALLPYRRQLRDLRKAMREDVEQLGWWLTILNLISGPLLVLMLTGLTMTWRTANFQKIIHPNQPPA